MMAIDTNQSQDVPKVTFQVSSTLHRIDVPAHPWCLGYNRRFLWLCNRIGACANRFWNSCSSKSVCGWLYCASWSHVSLRSSGDYLPRMWSWLYDSEFAAKPIPSFAAKRESSQEAAQDPIRCFSRIYGAQLDRNLRRQNILSGFFQEAHHLREQNSYILLDRGSHYIALMGICGGRAVHNLPTP